MRFNSTGKLAAIAIAATVSACTDAPKAIAPPAEIQTSMNANAQSHLPDWFSQASPEVLALPNTVFADLDEAHGRLLFGVEHAQAMPAVRNALARLGIPESAYAIVETAPIYQVATLRDVFRPTQAGIQIHFGGYLCSLGMNADDGTQRSMITASHCTNNQGGVEGTQYYQPLSSTNGTVIATEVEDPTYFKNGACPKGRVCRYSDAARAVYSSGVASNRGEIARTTGANNGSLTISATTPVFTVTSQDNITTRFAIGTEINKVGRTTGWTQGVVTNTCVNTNVSGTHITQLCQTFVSNPGGAVVVQGGDSGSDVFRITSGNNVEMVGILWGGNGNGTQFVFSPLKQVRDEIGPINVVQ
ncbi:MAG TPA: hypothetical protein VM099_09345 [Gemmatimonadaceae bacterium]|nr:hypothetical protein [Gemmatimonadaceae bacterium]